LFSPLYLIFPEAAVIFWIGYEDEVEARRGRKAEARQAEIDRKNWERREEEIAQNAEWMRAHPVEAARIERERQRRLEIEKMEHRAKMAAEAKERHEAQMAFEAAEEKRRHEERIALEAEERRRHEERMAIEAALAKPLSAEKAKLLSEMPFPPRYRTCSVLRAPMMAVAETVDQPSAPWKLCRARLPGISGAVSGCRPHGQRCAPRALRASRA